MKLSTYDRFNALAHAITERDNEREMQNLKSNIDRTKAFAEALNRATADYVLTGIGKIPESPAYSWVGWVRWDQRTYFQWDCYFAGLARDLKRPFVYATDHALIVQRRRYTEPLIGSFLLTATKMKHRWDSIGAGVSYRHTSDRWYFHFYGDVAQELRKRWLEDCKTNPEYRRALRLI